jgi:hypothetical protein
MPGDQSAVDVTIIEGSLGKAGIVLLHERRQFSQPEAGVQATGSTR